jgi:hypothetical protein
MRRYSVACNNNTHSPPYEASMSEIYNCIAFVNALQAYENIKALEVLTSYILVAKEDMCGK